MNTMMLTRTNHSDTPHLANHLAARAVGIPHQITADMPRSPADSGDQSVTQSEPPPCDLSGLTDSETQAHGWDILNGDGLPSVIPFPSEPEIHSEAGSADGTTPANDPVAAPVVFTPSRCNSLALLQEHLLAPGQFRLAAAVASQEDLPGTELTAGDLIALLNDSIRGLEFYVRGLEELNALSALSRRDELGVGRSLILPAVLSLIEQLVEPLPEDLAIINTLAVRADCCRRMIPEAEGVLAHSNVAILKGSLPGIETTLRIAKHPATEKVLDAMQIKRAELETESGHLCRMIDAAKTNSGDHMVRLHRIEMEIAAQADRMWELLRKPNFPDLDPADMPDVVDNLGLVFCPGVEVFDAFVPLFTAIDSHLACAITAVEDDRPALLPLAFFREGGTIEPLVVEFEPRLLGGSESQLIALLESSRLLRSLLDSLRGLVERVSLNHTARADYARAGKSALIPPFGSRPRLAAAMKALLEWPEPSLEFEDSILSILCSECRIQQEGGSGTELLVPLANFPSNLPLLAWVIALMLKRDSFPFAMLEPALRLIDRDFLSLVTFCRNCVCERRYSDLAIRLSCQLDKAAGDGGREISKVCLILLLDALICDDEPRRILKNLIPRVDDLRCLAAGIPTRSAAAALQPAVERIAKALTPNLDDYFGQEGLKVRAQAMIRRFLHVAEDPARLTGRKPCEVVKNGLLLPGAPGGGKTFFMDCLINTLGLHCFSVSADIQPGHAGAPSSPTQTTLIDLLERTITDAEAYVRSKNAACIVKLDEFEQFCLDRGLFKSHFEQTNRSLKLIERVRQNPRIFLLAATNHLSYVDKAMRRVGRFDVVREIDLPDAAAVRRIIEGAVLPFPEIVLTPPQIGEIAAIASGGELIPLSIIQTLTADILLTGRAPSFEELKAAMSETVADRSLVSARKE